MAFAKSLTNAKKNVDVKVDYAIRRARTWCIVLQ